MVPECISQIYRIQMPEMQLTSGVSVCVNIIEMVSFAFLGCKCMTPTNT